MQMDNTSIDQKRLAELAAEITRMAGHAGDGGGVTVREILARHRRNRGDLTAGSRALDEMAGRYLVAFFGNDRPAASVKPADAADWFGALQAGRISYARIGGNWAGPPKLTTALKHLQRAKTVYSEAVRDGLLISNPFAGMGTKSPTPPRDWRYVTDAETARLLAACPTAGWRTLIALCRWAALRVGEARGLRWGDVDLAGTPPRIVVHAEKTRRTRPVRVAPVQPRLAVVLREAHAVSPDSATRHGGVVVPAPLLEQGAGPSLYTQLRDIVATAGLEPWSKPFHTLRKNCATDWMDRSRELAVVADWLGHDPAVSRSHYLASQSERLLIEEAGTGAAS